MNCKPAKMKITVIVITYNEEENIKECLDTVKWCDEIIVVDSQSKDRTVQLAQNYTDKIILTENITYSQKRNIGIENASGEWILWIDADERVTEDLKEEINRAITDSKMNNDAFLVNRKTYFINKFVKHCGWYPDHRIRLFKKLLNLRFNDSLVHEKINYKGASAKLKSSLLHYSDKTFEHYIKKMNKYTTLSSQELFSQNKDAGLIDIIFRPAFTFFKMYFLKLGLLDGYTGLVLCSLSSVHVFIKYSKLYFMYKKNKLWTN